MGIISVLIIACTLSLVFKKRIENTLAPAMISVSLVIYLVGMFLPLSAGVYLVMALSICSLLYCIIFFVKDRASYEAYIFTSGFAFFLFCVVFFALTGIGRGLYRSADLNTWGYLVKKMHYYDSLHIADGAGSYPRATMLLNYFITKTWIGFSEGMMLFSQNLFTVSLLLPFFCFVRKNNRALKNMILGISILLLPLVVNDSTYASLFPDSLLGILFGYCIIKAYELYVEKNNFSCIELLLGLYSLCLTKRLGVSLAAIVVFIYVYLIFDKENRNKKRAILPASLTVWVFLTYVSWNGIGTNALLPVCAAFGGIVLHNIVKLFKKVKNEAKYSALACSPFAVLLILVIARRLLSVNNYLLTNNYLKQLLTVWESSIGFVVPISLGSFMLISAASLFLFFRYYSFSDVEKKSISSKFIFLLYLGNIAYLLLLWLEYVIEIAFAETNKGFGIYATSFERYSMPCYLSIIIVGIYVVLVNINEIKVNVAVISFVVFLMFVNTDYIVDYVFVKYEQPEYYGFEQAGIEITENDKIYFIDEDKSEDLTDSLSFMYAMLPAECDVRNELYGFTLKSNNFDYISAKELSDKLLDNGFTYVYIQTIDENFLELYGSLFESDKDIKTGAVYSVNEMDGQLRLVLE